MEEDKIAALYSSLNMSRPSTTKLPRSRADSLYLSVLGVVFVISAAVIYLYIKNTTLFPIVVSEDREDWSQMATFITTVLTPVITLGGYMGLNIQLMFSLRVEWLICTSNRQILFMMI